MLLGVISHILNLPAVAGVEQLSFIRISYFQHLLLLKISQSKISKAGSLCYIYDLVFSFQSSFFGINDDTSHGVLELYLTVYL